MRQQVFEGLYWLLLAIIICIIAGLSQMYARDVTLDHVRLIDFKMIKQTLMRFDSNGISYSEALPVLNALTISEQRYVLFPVAIITLNNCVENGEVDHSRSICKQFRVSASFFEYITTSESHSYYGQKYVLFDGGVFLYSKIGNSSYLVGRAGYLVVADEASKIIDYMTNRVPYHLFTKNGLQKMLVKGKLIFLTIFSLVLTGYLSFKVITHQIKKRNIKQIEALQLKLGETRSQIEKLAQDRESVNLELYQIKLQKEELQQSFEEQHQESAYFAEEYEKLESKIVEIKYERDDLIGKIEETENNYEQLIEEVQQQADRSGLNEIEKELRVLRQQQSELRKLWKQTTKWSSRLTIEHKYSDSGRAPFTASIAFIAFEQYVDEYIEGIMDRNRYDDFSNTTLKKKIDWIKHEDRELCSILHEIRIARNKWFHSGVAPKKGLLISLLEQVKSEEPRV
jgi:hypothetical protein